MWRGRRDVDGWPASPARDDWSALAHLPDLFGRPAAGPVVVDELRVRGLRALGCAEVDERLDVEAVIAEQRQPFAVRELELGDAVGPGDVLLAEPAPAELLRRAVIVVGEPLEEARDVERQQPARAQEARYLGHRDRRVAE